MSDKSNEDEKMESEHIEEQKGSQALTAQHCLGSVQSHFVEGIQVLVAFLFLLPRRLSRAVTIRSGRQTLRLNAVKGFVVSS
jgi:hypothetical protein